MDALSLCKVASCCLALTLYHECRNSDCSYLEQLAIYHTVYNRVKDPAFPDSVCEVVTDTKHAVQFQWYGDNRDDTPKDERSWKKVRETVRLFRISRLPDPTYGSVCFHRKDKPGGWQCGNHHRDFKYHRFYYNNEPMGSVESN